MIGLYGQTPFGRHVLSRGNVTVVEKYTLDIRNIMLTYSALMELNKVTEHVVYGNYLPYSWLHGLGASLSSTDIRAEKIGVELEPCLYGDFRNDAIAYLRATASRHPELPTLALHKHTMGKSYYHCVTARGEINVAVDEELDLDAHQHYEIYRHPEYGDCVLCRQGVTQVYDSFAIGLPAEKVENYICGAEQDHEVAHKIFTNSILETHCRMSVMSTVLDTSEGSVLCYIPMPAYNAGAETYKKCYRARQV